MAKSPIGAPVLGKVVASEEEIPETAGIGTEFCTSGGVTCWTGCHTEGFGLKY